MATGITATIVGCNKEAIQESNLTDPSAPTSLSAAVEGHYIVQLDASFARDLLEGVLDYQQRNVILKGQIELMLQLAGLADVEVGFTYHSTIIGFSAILDDAQRQILENLPFVIRIEQDLTVHINDTKIEPNTNKSSSQQTPYGINRVGSVDGSGKRAYVIDTGVDLDHPDLNVNKDLSISYTGGGVIGEVTGNGDGNDDHGHGTHVAGIIAAKNNGIGVIGVAHDAEIVAVKVLAANGSGTMTGVIAGVDYVALNGMPGDVANMSLSGSAFDLLDLVVTIASSKGIMFALAAGNDRHDANLNSPARANGANIYTVSAMNSSDRWASFSNYGNPPVDYCAPGAGILSTFKNGGYRTLSGTSMAAPHIAGILLARGGAPLTDGYVSNDPDGNADPIGVVY